MVVYILGDKRDYVPDISFMSQIFKMATYVPNNYPDVPKSLCIMVCMVIYGSLREYKQRLEVSTSLHGSLIGRSENLICTNSSAEDTNHHDHC